MSCKHNDGFGSSLACSECNNELAALLDAPSYPPPWFKEREEMIALLRDEVLPVMRHAVEDYACGRALSLEVRLAAFLEASK